MDYDPAECRLLKSVKHDQVNSSPSGLPTPVFQSQPHRIHSCSLVEDVFISVPQSVARRK